MGYATAYEHRLTDDQIKQIFDLHQQGIGLREIGRRLSVSHKSVSYRLNKNAIRDEKVVPINRVPRGHAVRDTGRFDWDRFRSLPEKIKAYWAGFIAADGTVTSKSVRIELSKKDASHLTWWVQFGVTAKFTKRGSCLLVVNSMSLVEWLASWDVFPRKTGNEVFPHKQPELLFAYIQGLLDGDGSVSVRNDNLSCSIVSASNSFLCSVRDFLSEHNIVSHVHKYHPKDKSPYSKLLIYERASLRLFAHFQRDVYLERKIDKVYNIDKSNKTHTRYSDAVLDKIKDFRKQGKTTREIARLVGKSKSGVGYVIQQLGS